MSDIDGLIHPYSKCGLRLTAVALPGSFLDFQNLHFNKNPTWIACTLKSEKY